VGKRERRDTGKAGLYITQKKNNRNPEKVRGVGGGGGGEGEEGTVLMVK